MRPRPKATTCCSPTLSALPRRASQPRISGKRWSIRRIEHAAQMSPHLVEFLRRPWTAQDLTDAVVMRKKVCNTMWRFMRRFDLLITPTSAVPAFLLNIRGPAEIDGRSVPPIKWTSFTLPFNLTGQPA